MPIIVDDAVSTVALRAWARDITPHVPQCPLFSIDYQVLQKAIEFCRESRAWRQLNTELATTVAGQSDYDLDLPDQTEATWLISAWVGEDEADVENPGEQDAFEPGSSDTKWVVGLADQDSIRLTPAPSAAGVVVKGTICFAPDQDATALPDFLWRRWRMAIAHGVIAALQTEMGKPWSSAGTVAYHAGLFDAGVMEAANLAGEVRRRGANVALSPF